MKKNKRVFRNTVRVFPTTAKNALHHFAENPNTGWAWVAYGDLHEGFEKLEDAKADAARVLGPIDWKGKQKYLRGIEGDYGAEMTPEEFLDLGQERNHGKNRGP